MQKKIRTTGQLREFLAAAIIEVKDGSLSIDKAARITKLSHEINDSFYSEIKLAKMSKELGLTIPKFGEIPINEGDNG